MANSAQRRYRSNFNRVLIRPRTFVPCGIRMLSAQLRDFRSATQGNYGLCEVEECSVFSQEGQTNMHFPRRFVSLTKYVLRLTLTPTGVNLYLQIIADWLIPIVSTGVLPAVFNTQLVAATGGLGLIFLKTSCRRKLQCAPVSTSAFNLIFKIRITMNIRGCLVVGSPSTPDSSRALLSVVRPTHPVMPLFP